MRFALFILAAYALVAWNDAHSQETANVCQVSVLLANKAYLEGTYDAQRPDVKRLRYMVDYWGGMMTIRHDPKIAFRATIYIAARLKDAGFRQPPEAAVYQAAREYMVKECPL